MKKLAALIFLLSVNLIAFAQDINRTKINVADSVLTMYIGRYTLDTDPHKIYTVQMENGDLYIREDDDEKIEITPDTPTTFFDDPQSADGYVFILNPQTSKYDLTIISAGLKLTTKRL